MKHDAFVNLDFSDKKTLKDIVVDFDGGLLFQSETDGSSFPNGGLRATHTAAAFTVWCARAVATPMGLVAEILF